MSANEREYQVIFSYLRSLHFHYLNTWVEECVDYYKIKRPNISIEELKDEVEQQWLLVNLRDIKVPSLPPNLVSLEKTILHGKYVVQVEAMIDSSESCYSQWQRLQKKSNEVLDDERTDKFSCQNRCLVFDVCDGVQEVRAMEYKPIKKIRTDDPVLLPGFKMLIIGPVECRKGMILLKDDNVKICGGEVDTLRTSNNLRSILIKKLDLDETDSLECHNVSDVECVNESESVMIEEPSTSNINEENVESLLSQNDDLFLSLPLQTDEFEQNVNFSEENILMSLKRDNENKCEKNYVTHSVSEHDSVVLSPENVFHNNFSTPNLKHYLSQENLLGPDQKRISLDQGVDDDCQSINNKNFAIKNLSNPTDQNKTLVSIDGSQEFQNCRSKSLETAKAKSTLQTKLSSFFSSNISQESSVFIDKSSFEVPNTIKTINAKPFVYLKQIISEKFTRPSIFTIKGVILTLKKKITIKQDEFNLKVVITDGSMLLDVEFCSLVLENLMGFSPCEMSAMIKAKSTNSAVADRIKQVFNETQKKLISLNCLMEIKFFTDERCPLILSLKEVTEQNLKELENRMLKKN